MEDIKVNVASNLLKLRNAAGITQMELAQKLNYTDKAVSKWERAESLPDVTVLKQIADMFGVTVDYLITSHAEWEVVPAKAKDLHFRPNAVITVSLFGILAVATLVFIIFWLLGHIYWSIFIYAAPVAFITALVMNSLWNSGKGNIVLVSLLVASIIPVVYVAFYQAGQNPWQLFILAPILELIALASFHVKKKNKNKENH